MTIIIICFYLNNALDIILTIEENKTIKNGEDNL